MKRTDDLIHHMHHNCYAYPPMEERLTTPWMNEWMDGWVDGRMDGWMDEWVNGWMDACMG